MLKAILGLAVGVLILGVWLYVVGFQEILAALRTVSPYPALVATLAWALAMRETIMSNRASR